MKTRKLLFGLLGCALMGLQGQNLLQRGDFSECQKDIFGECRSNGGKISLFMEEYTWNRCGKLEIDRIIKTKEGHDLASASVWIGGDKTTGGFVAKPNTTYRFSVEIRGTAPNANISALEWVGDRLWYDFKQLKTNVGSIRVQKGWTRYQGTFKTGSKAKRAALCLGLWHSTQYGPMTMKVGDYILFDNVRVEEHRQQLGAPKRGALSVKPIKAICAPVVKTAPVVDGKLEDAVWKDCERFEDFVLFKKHGACSALTWAKVLVHGENLYLAVRCEDDKKVVGTVTKNGTDIWQDDVVEIFFGPKTQDRILSQFAVGAGGGRFTGRGTGEVDGYGAWEGKVTTDAKGWNVEARISLKELGWTKPVAAGDKITFNLCRQRKLAGENQTWNPLQQTFHEPASFGQLVVGDYAKALELTYGVKQPTVKSRQDYEKADASIRLARLQAKYDALSKRVFSVAPVPVNGEFAIPFMPDEVFSPVESIALKAAVNEIKPLPVAVANLTDKVAAYRVILETRSYYNGTYGLKDFPPEQITVREALRFKDSDEDKGSLRLDPLPKMNEAFVITVPPREAGVVWFDFDTTGVKPGTYDGRLRVIPLSETATWISIKGSFHHRKYTGAMQDIPVSLEVRNIVLDRLPKATTGFFQYAMNEKMFRSMLELGTTNFGISPWNFQFDKDKDGNLDITKGTKYLENNKEIVRNHVRWAKKYKIHPTFFIGFSGYHSFCSINGLKTESEKSFRLWPQWIRGICQVMKDCGVPASDFTIETFDEPDPKWFPLILKLHKLAKEAVPEIQLELTLGAHIMKASDMEVLSPLTDGWTLWRHGYFSRPEHVAFVKKAMAEGKLIRHYTCSTSMRAHLDRNYRHHAWFAERHGISGNMMYIFSELYSEYGAVDFKLAHLGSVAYRSFDGYIPSIRYMSLRQGMMDVKYLDLLRKNWGDRPDVQAFLKTAGKRVVLDFAHDPTMSDKVREEAAELILKLQR